MIKNIIFDFDGVLVESVNVKTEAFKQLYMAFGDAIVTEVEAYHLANGGMSRFDKIRYYHTQLLKQPITDEQVGEWADKFSEIVLQRVIEADEVVGAKQFLDEESTDFNCWIITGTPTNEIIHIVQEKKWENYFRGIHGSPQNKKYWVEYLKSTFDLRTSETVFVGDALADYEAACLAGFHFILRKTEENKYFFNDFSGISIENISFLKQAIASLNE